MLTQCSDQEGRNLQSDTDQQPETKLTTITLQIACCPHEIWKTEYVKVLVVLILTQ